jgi:hypothetical protein
VFFLGVKTPTTLKTLRITQTFFILKRLLTRELGARLIKGLP